MKKRLIFNTVSSVLLQVVTVVCGFILPRLILGQFGSQVNGLVQSITRFLSIISFLELGIGYVIQSSLYKPLLENDRIRISEIVSSGSKFFVRIAQVLLIYVVILTIIFPFFQDDEFSWLYTSTLILSISISFFAQYYFGIINRLLLNADQRGYIQYTTQIVIIILNTIVSVVLIKTNQSIQIVKLGSSLVFLAGPLFLNYYVNSHYKINRRISYVEEPIKQKWNGIAVHISQTVLNETDTIVLTVFSTWTNVSIYSVYNLVVNGVKQLVITSTAGFDSIIGKLWASENTERLRKAFALIEWWIHFVTIFVFSCTYVLILPFISYYTRNITDAEYIQPLFAALIIAAQAGHCLRLPYNKMIMACGHFKQTQKCYILSAILNLVISCIAVYQWGLIGVALGTLVAMYYQTIWMACYNTKKLLRIPFHCFVKQIAIDILYAASVIVSTSMLEMNEISFVSFVVLAIKVAVIAGGLGLLLNFVFYRKNINEALLFVVKKAKS